MIVFLSKDSDACPEWIRWCAQNGVQTLCHSLIDFEAVFFSCPKETDVVFFTSPRSADFFFASCPHADFSWACVGSGTADHLRRMGKEVAFAGRTSADPQQVGLEFQEWLGSRRVFFPISNQSLKTISGQIPEAQKQETIVYKTQEKEVKIQPCDWYVFTSPSNARAFLHVHELPTEGRVVAWGKSTARFLSEQGVSVYKTLEDSSVEALIRFFDQN